MLWPRPAHGFQSRAHKCNALTPQTDTGVRHSVAHAAARMRHLSPAAPAPDLSHQADILEALDERWISGAVLDVFSVEPLPVASELWAHPNVTITPHVAAVSFPKDVGRIFADNLVRYLGANDNGEALERKLKYVVAWKNGY